jgi:hypothetical protein
MERMIANAKAYTFASHTSPSSIQSLQKSMLFPTLRKNKKSSTSFKNKTLLTRNPTDKNGMTEQTENIKGMSLEKKEGQLVTGGIFYCRDSAGFSVSASNKLSCNLTVKCFEIGNKNIPPIRYAQAEK